ncbi:MAG: hypothetical protein EA344_08085 [Alkalicoccus sp.]|nr:MAG: hypothetical protein EA344_08085 [Alkalicoccus sp.]
MKIEAVFFDKELVFFRNGGEAGGISVQSDHGAGLTAEGQPRDRLPPVREGASTLTGITILER